MPKSASPVNQTDSPTASTRTRSPWRIWWLGLGVILLLRLIGDFVPLASPTGWLWITRFGEMWLVGGLGVWVLSRVPRAEIRASIGPVRSGAVVVLVAAMAAGHFVGSGEGAHPFVKWNMYTSGAAEVTYGEVWLVDGSGQRRQLELAPLGITTEPRATSGRLVAEAEAAADGDPEAQSLLTDTVQALSARSGLAAEGAEILRCTVTEPTLPAPSVCEVVTTVELGASG